MIQYRNIVVCILLTIVTCGIYGIVWIVSMVDDVNTVTGRQGLSGGLVFLLSLVTCGIFMLVWMYQAGEALDQLRYQNGRPTGSQGILFLLLSLFGLSIVACALMQNELNLYAAL